MSHSYGHFFSRTFVGFSKAFRLQVPPDVFWGFYRVLSGFIRFFRVLPGCTGFYRVLLDSIELLMVLSGFTEFFSGFTGF